jgi:hypothetical protein
LFRWLILTCLLPGSSGAASGETVEFPIPYPVHPILIYDVSGSSLIGEFHVHLTVYSDGVVRFSEWSRSELFPPPEGGEETRVSGAFVGEQAARELGRALLRAGAHRIEGGISFCQDGGTTRVTVFRLRPAELKPVLGDPPARFRSRSDALSHTFVYDCHRDDRIDEVEAIIREFIRRWIPAR